MTNWRTAVESVDISGHTLFQTAYIDDTTGEIMSFDGTSGDSKVEKFINLPSSILYKKTSPPIGVFYRGYYSGTFTSYGFQTKNNLTSFTDTSTGPGAWYDSSGSNQDNYLYHNGKWISLMFNNGAYGYARVFSTTDFLTSTKSTTDITGYNTELATQIAYLPSVGKYWIVRGGNKPGRHESTDLLTWTGVGLAGSDYFTTVCEFNNKIYVANGRTLRESSDGGNTWTTGYSIQNNIYGGGDDSADIQRIFNLTVGGQERLYFSVKRIDGSGYEVREFGYLTSAPVADDFSLSGQLFANDVHPSGLVCFPKYNNNGQAYACEFDGLTTNVLVKNIVAGASISAGSFYGLIDAFVYFSKSTNEWFLVVHRFDDVDYLIHEYKINSNNTLTSLGETVGGGYQGTGQRMAFRV